WTSTSKVPFGRAVVPARLSVQLDPTAVSCGLLPRVYVVPLTLTCSTLDPVESQVPVNVGVVFDVVRGTTVGVDGVSVSIVNSLVVASSRVLPRMSAVWTRTL